MRNPAQLTQIGVALAIASLAACSTTIGSGLSESQANEVVVALAREGIAATKAASTTAGQASGFEVAVADSNVASALEALRAAGLPRQEEPGLREVFAGTSLVPTATEERARYVAALSGELSRSIESIPGVLDARVHVALPAAIDLPLDAEPPRPHASVLIKYAGTAQPYEPASVQALVAGAVDRLRAEDVHVIGLAAGAPAPRTAAFVHIGPIAVARGSAGTLKMFAALALGLHIALAAALIVSIRRRRAAAGAQTPAE